MESILYAAGPFSTPPPEAEAREAAQVRRKKNEREGRVPAASLGLRMATHAEAASCCTCGPREDAEARPRQERRHDDPDWPYGQSLALGSTPHASLRSVCTP